MPSEAATSDKSFYKSRVSIIFFYYSVKMYTTEQVVLMADVSILRPVNTALTDI